MYCPERGDTMPARAGGGKGGKGNSKQKNNQSENKEAEKVSRRYNMSPEEHRRFHDEVSKQKYSPEELDKVAQSLVERNPGEKRENFSKAERRKRRRR